MIPLEDQMEAFDEHVDEAFDDLIDWILEERDNIICAARDRMEAGYYEYGDLMWSWDEERRCSEKTEEVADALVYSIPDYE